MNSTAARLVWIALAVTALRILYLCINQRNLDVEEAQYWTWSQHLALGYHSKPPMISWIIYFSTRIFGDGEWAIRLFSPITYLLTALFLYGCGAHLYNRTIGFWAGLTVLLLPGVTYSATISSTDPFLILFWSIALYLLIKALDTDNILLWVGCGAAIGLGLLSKYTMLAFFLSMGLYLICAIENAPAWKKPGPYLAALIAALIFLPNVIWNAQHHNAALAHVLQHNIDVQGFHLNLNNLALFFLSQIGILGPVLIVFLILALVDSRKTIRRENTRLLLCFTLPMLLLISIEALLSRAYANWAAAAYPSGVILAVAYMWEHDFRRWLRFSVWLNIVITIILCGWELAVAYGYCNWPKPGRPDWRDFGAKIAQQQAADPNTLYLVDDRELWAKTLYYGKVSRSHLFVWDPQQTVDWVDNPAHLTVPRGKDFIFITHNADLPDRRLDSFLVGQRLLGRQNHIYMYRLHNRP